MSNLTRYQATCTHTPSMDGRPCPFCGLIVPDGRTAATSGTCSQETVPVGPRAAAEMFRPISAASFVSLPVHGQTGSETPTLFDPPATTGSHAVDASGGLASVSNWAPASSPKDAGAPIARLTDPPAAHEAAARVAEWAQVHRWIVLCAHADAGEHGLTGNELEQVTGRPYAKLGPRRPALERDGLVRKLYRTPSQPVRRDGQQVYVITSTGVEHAHAVRARSNYAP